MASHAAWWQAIEPGLVSLDDYNEAVPKLGGERRGGLTVAVKDGEPHALAGQGADQSPAQPGAGSRTATDHGGAALKRIHWSFSPLVVARASPKAFRGPCWRRVFA